MSWPVRSAALCALACLALVACDSKPKSSAQESDAIEAPAAGRSKAAHAFVAHRDEVGYQRCIEYPNPAGSHWRADTIEANCADGFTEAFSRDDVRRMIAGGQGRELDVEFDGLVEDHLAGKLPEGALVRVYSMFFRLNVETDALMEHWLEQSPGSAHAFAARGINRVHRAASARGEASISKTSPEKIRHMLNELRRAQRDLDQAIERNPRLLMAYAALINLASFGGERPVADAAIEHALAVDPRNYFVRATYLQALEPRWFGSLEQMRAFAEEAKPHLVANPRLATLTGTVMAEQAIALSNAGNGADAVRKLAEAVAESPGGALRLAANVATDRGDHDEAIAMNSQVLRFRPRDEDARADRAASYLAMQRYDDARADLDLALAENPDHAAALRVYGHLLLSEGDFTGAEEKLENSHAADPENIQVIRNLAWVYLYQKRSYAEAGRMIQKFLELRPKSGDAWLMRTTILQLQRGPGLREAAENFVLYADPANEEHRRHLDKVKDWLASQDGR